MAGGHEHGDHGGEDWSEDWSYLDDDDTPPYWEAGRRMPEDARRMGLTHHVPDGALLDFAGALDSSKPLHRVTAWVMLVLVTLPVFFYVLRLVLAVA